MEDLITKGKVKDLSAYHICMPIKKALELVRKGQNPFDVPRDEAERQLLERKAQGKEYITGCDNEDETGKLKGGMKKR